MAGSGTQIDPWVVSNWDEFSEYNVVDNIGSYVKFANHTTINFGRVYPQGFTTNTGLIIYPNIIGNDAHWRHLVIFGNKFSTKAINFKGTVEGLYIDGLFVNEVLSIIELENDAENLRVTCQFKGGSASDVYMLSKAYLQNFTLTNCQMEFKGKSRFVYFLGGRQANHVRLNNCEIYLDWDCNTGQLDRIDLNASTIKGIAKCSTWLSIYDTVKQVTDTTYPDSLIDLKADTPMVIWSSYPDQPVPDAAAFYNSDKMTFTVGTTSWTALDSATLADETALNNAGFTTGGDSPWEFDNGDLLQADWIELYYLGGFNHNTMLYGINQEVGSDNNVLPLSMSSIGRYSFRDSNVRNITLPTACTYYSTSFRDNMPVTGGTLIE